MPGPSDATNPAPPTAGVTAACAALDAEIIARLEARYALSRDIPSDPATVATALANLAGRYRGPLPPESLKAIFREVLAACRRHPLTVAYLGPPGSFSQAASHALLGQAQVELALASVDEVFHAGASGQANYIVVPIENSTEGAVNRSMDLLRDTPLKIEAEVSLNIRHCLLSQSGQKEAIRRIFAHPQAAAQCRGWLAQHCPGIVVQSVSSNSQAAQEAADDPGAGAIAGEQAALIYCLQTVQANIQDEAGNQTRFLLLSKGRPALGQAATDRPPALGLQNLAYRTSLILAVRNEAGALYRLLAPLAENGVSMTRFESRPAHGSSWEYFFYLDLEGTAEQPQVEVALTILQGLAAYYKNLGSYPVLPPPQDLGWSA
jgi:chorismate mutase/prephenate dehydratase